MLKPLDQVQNIRYCNISLKKFVIAAIIFSVTYIFNDIMTGVAMYRAPQGPGWIDKSMNSLHEHHNVNNSTEYYAVLPDIGFDLIPYFPPEIATKILIGYMIVTLLKFALDPNHQHNLGILIRFMLVDSVLFAMRGVTINATSMNNPYPPCFNCGGAYHGHCPDTIWAAIYLTVQKFPLFDCGDLMFSGHTVHYMLCTLIWTDYYFNRDDNRKSWVIIVLKYILWILTFGGLLLIIAERLHYTNDVIIGFLLTLFVWYLYHYVIDHFMVKASQGRDQYLQSYARSSYATRFILWMESIEAHIE